MSVVSQSGPNPTSSGGGKKCAARGREVDKSFAECVQAGSAGTGHARASRAVSGGVAGRCRVMSGECGSGSNRGIERVHGSEARLGVRLVRASTYLCARGIVLLREGSGGVPYT